MDDALLVTDAGTAEEVSLKLEASPFVVQPAIVCRATCCYRTADQKHVVKLSWRSDKRRPEAEHLMATQKKAKKGRKSVEGVARLLGWRDVTTIAELRKGLTYGKPRRLRISAPRADSFDPSKSSFTTQSTNQLKDMNLSEGTKRKNGAGDWLSSKKSRSNSQKSNLSYKVQADEPMKPTRYRRQCPTTRSIKIAS